MIDLGPHWVYIVLAYLGVAAAMAGLIMDHLLATASRSLACLAMRELGADGLKPRARSRIVGHNDEAGGV